MKKFLYIIVAVFTLLTSTAYASSKLMINGRYLDYRQGMRIVHLGDSHVAGKVFPNAVKTTLKSKNYFVVAKNGVTIDYFMRYDVFNKVKSYRPDMIILSVGTNESMGKINMSSYMNKIHNFMVKYSPVTTNVLITTPAGNFKGGKFNQNVNDVVTSQAMFGALYEYAVWNLFEYNGASWWKSHGMMDKYGIHFTPKAYKMQGQKLATDIMAIK